MEERTYSLELTERQLADLSFACELVSRLHMKQVDMLSPFICDVNQETLRKVKRLLFPETPMNGYTGIGNADDQGKILWDLYQVIRYFLAWNRSDNTPDKRDWTTQMSVQFDEPMKTSGEPLAKIKEA